MNVSCYRGCDFCGFCFFVVVVVDFFEGEFMISIDIFGYCFGIWVFDFVYSEVMFSVCYMMILKVCGMFGVKSVMLIVFENLFDVKVEVSVDVILVDIKDEGCDVYLCLVDFFDIENFFMMEFVFMGVCVEKGEFFVDGDLIICGIMKFVIFEFDFGGFGSDLWGNYKVGVLVKIVINCEDFGFIWNVVFEIGGVFVGKDVMISFDLQGVLQQD